MAKKPEEVVGTIYRHLVLKVDDLAVVIIKGHLIIEELLVDLLAARVFRDRVALEAADLKFFQKVQLCRAWAGLKGMNALWELILKLNTLRNDLGHSLAAPKRKALLADIRHGYKKLTASAPDLRVNDVSSDDSLLGATFALVAGVLLAITDPTQAPPMLDDFAKRLQDDSPAK